MSNLVTFEQKKAMMALGYPTPVAPVELQPRDINGNLMFPEVDKYDFHLTVSSALDWIREEKSDEIVFEISVTTYHNLVRYMYRVREYTLNLGTYEQITHGIDYPTHPLAESALLTAVLNYLIEKKQ